MVLVRPEAFSTLKWKEGETTSAAQAPADIHDQATFPAPRPGKRPDATQGRRRTCRRQPFCYRLATRGMIGAPEAHREVAPSAPLAINRPQRENVREDGNENALDYWRSGGERRRYENAKARKPRWRNRPSPQPRRIP